MATKNDTTNQTVYDLLDNLREVNRMSAEDQETIANAKQVLLDAGAEAAEDVEEG
jgi:hypothetical protein